MGKIATACGILLLAFASEAGASEQPVVDRLCEGTAYERALCAYHQGRLDDAVPALRELAAGEPSPTAIRARYFLARSLMRRAEWEEAGRELVTLFGNDPGFYRAWGCDFLLGVTRRQRGLD